MAKQHGTVYTIEEGSPWAIGDRRKVQKYGVTNDSLQNSNR
jgi:hypothetical protein